MPVKRLDRLTTLDLRIGFGNEPPYWAESKAILTLLRLSNVKDLSIYLEEAFYCKALDSAGAVVEIQRVLGHIPFKALETFSLALEYPVLDLPESCPWVSDMCIETESTNLTDFQNLGEPRAYCRKLHHRTSSRYVQPAASILLLERGEPTRKSLHRDR
jgi:hypothetical protein